MKVFIESIVIYETYHPGAIVEIYAYDYIEEKWINIWSIFDSGFYKTNQSAINRPLPPKASRRFEPELKRNNIYTE